MKSSRDILKIFDPKPDTFTPSNFSTTTYTNYCDTVPKI